MVASLRLIDPERFNHSLLEQQLIEIERNSEILTREILSDNQGPFLIAGVMGAGKTSVLKKVANSIADKKNLIIYRLNDDRAPEGEIYDRNITPLFEGIEVKTFNFQEGIVQIINEITQLDLRDMVMFISEAQFGGATTELLQLIDLARDRKIVLIFDCLDRYYNGRKITETEFISRVCSEENKFHMKPCDSFDECEWGNIPARFVAISETGEVVYSLDAERSHYYSSMSTQERQELVSRFRKVAHQPVMSNLSVLRDGKICYLFPSHPSRDEEFIPGGNERYKSTNIQTIIQILSLLDLNDVAEEYSSIYNSDISFEG